MAAEPEAFFALGKLEDYKQWRVLINPASTGAKKWAAHQVKELLADQEDYGKTVETFQLDPSNPVASGETQEQLFEKLDGSIGIIVMGGDGTFSRLVNYILNDPYLARLHIPLLAGGAGYGNDIATSHTGRVRGQRLADILHSGKITPTLPVETHLSGPGGVKSHHAVAEVGFFGTGLGAKLFDRKSVRESRLNITPPTRFALSTFVVAETVILSKNFEIEVEGKGKGTYSEITFANYGREALYGRWPTQPTDPRIYRSELGPKSYLKSINWLGRLASGSVHLPISPPAGVYMGPNERYRFTTLSDETPMTRDGEYDILPQGTLVDIGLGRTPFYAVTTKL